MHIIGAYVPLSIWTLVVILLGAAVGLLIHKPLVSRGWAPRPTTVALVATTLVLSLTLAPGMELDRPDGLDQCLAAFPYVLYRLGYGGEGLLNIALLMPLGFALIRAVPRWWLAALIVLILPVGIELIQILIPGRVCAPSDLLNNVFGGLLGMFAGSGVKDRDNQKA
ncbi:VanZ family protein [Pseudonocardiaceae bacterium YIM PH 21723]|nr:VanZ family protein [Pseudonocardiaceae bacterium YIM PH 21723]